jgi:predicted ATPase
VLRCGLTGGFGSGKSTVAAGLVGAGAGLVEEKNDLFNISNNNQTIKSKKITEKKTT